MKLDVITLGVTINIGNFVCCNYGKCLLKFNLNPFKI